MTLSPQAERKLRAFLAEGSRLSSEVIAAMAEAGFTPKQIRRAREKLGVQITRTGYGGNMRSSWALPGESCGGADRCGHSDPHSCPPDDRWVSGQLRDVTRTKTYTPAPQKSLRMPARPSHLAGTAPPVDLTGDERKRVDRRVGFFIMKGLAASDASTLAIRLVFERDRRGTRLASCAECQSPMLPGGARQDSCRLIHAASGCLSSAVESAATTESRSGLSVTAPRGDQSRVGPDHRAGLRSRALRYSAWRAARMA
jgi:hypothetical protein